MKKMHLLLMLLAIPIFSSPMKEKLEGFNLPPEVTYQIIDSLNSAETLKEAYTDVVHFLSASKQLSGWLTDEDFMKYFVDQLYKKFIKVADGLKHEDLDAAIDLALAMKKHPYALERAEELINEMSEEKQKEYFDAKLNSKERKKIDLLSKNREHLKYRIDDLLLSAVLNLKEEQVKNLVALGANVNDDAFSTTPLVSAISEGNFPIIKYLIEQGAEVNKKTTQGISPLFAAVRQNDFPLVQYLVSKGAKKEERALALAREKGYQDIVEFLEK